MAEATARQNLKKVYRFGYVLRMLGCGFSLDRFGGQVASYALLDKLPVKYIKPDPAFIHDLVTDSNRQQALLQLTQRVETLQIATVVSCIEDSNLLQVLTQCGVRFAQGYSLQRPDAEMNYDFNSMLVT
jgi:EAL domain-containing protein (putative c-di-GMP-specific phosphodiesterase class I)